MTVANVMTKLGEEITQIIKEYDATDASKDSEGTRIDHILDAVTDPEKLIAINKGLTSTALNCSPRDLWKTTGTDLDPKLFDVNSTTYVMVPAIATNTGDDLNISLDGTENSVRIDAGTVEMEGLIVQEFPVYRVTLDTGDITNISLDGTEDENKGEMIDRPNCAAYECNPGKRTNF